ncbi:hypothetical protein HRM2_19100 [Desulforapulum autotrophicum HRM2]|uniref:Uncharacterized protein n=1 Tax=Desulforapulum autotrophicum (strain ATCC 43914 / DSM 3382 / VKM B-1955 / HRM2) TaxID=177437 RepID=C0QBZ9_DESAH|nr:hypothetical protein [Desulforapulum autotrophicum]ACN15011.1 hypothetical protein HRM2_19100 [Desulforapulum autotrophicum HRM2]
MDGQSFRFGNTPPTPAAKFISEINAIFASFSCTSVRCGGCPPEGGFVLAEIALGAWMVFFIINFNVLNEAKNYERF